jgi:uncharacterized protein YecE (DUF72 family)
MSDKRKVMPAADPTPALFDMGVDVPKSQCVEPELAIPGVRLGTSAFTAAGWLGSFYPTNMNPRDYLSYYATKFNSVEIDSTFYGCPPAERFNRWYEVTPPDFVFALKVPQVVTHDKCLLGCEKEFDEFIGRAALLKDKLGPLLLQFGHFTGEQFEAPRVFFNRLRSFLQNTKGISCRFAVEIRNKEWLTVEFAGLLRDYGVALALQDRTWMPLPATMAFDYVTTDFSYVRLLGDRHGIERQTTVWDKEIVDRTRELTSWVDMCQRIVKRGVSLYVYINNHYSGHAPATVAQFVKLWSGSTDTPRVEHPRRDTLRAFSRFAGMFLYDLFWILLQNHFTHTIQNAVVTRAISQIQPDGELLPLENPVSNSTHGANLLHCRSPFLCALSASNIGSVTHPAETGPSHPICPC